MTKFELAKQIIWDLRHDPETREHFSILSWDGKGTCGTVGCIAGTALARKLETTRESRLYFRLLDGDRSIVSRAQEALEIEFHETATHLFVPWKQAEDLISSGKKTFSYLPEQARPRLETVEEMIQWARRYRVSDQMVSPDCAAQALEQVTVNEMPYCNWAKACQTTGDWPSQMPDTSKDEFFSEEIRHV